MTAESQKSYGRFASSGGDVRSISSSLMRRSLLKSARPTLGILACLRLAIQPPFACVASTRRDDPAYSSSLVGAIGIDDGQMEAVCDTDRYDSRLTVIRALVLP